MGSDEAILKAEKAFIDAIQHLKAEYARLQLGRANPALVDNVPVEMYGVSQPLKAVASISVPDPRTIQIQPWDKHALGPIEKGIVGAGLGLNPVNDGMVVRISIPPLTEERRTDLTKHVHKLAEDARISVRNARQEAHNSLKELKTKSEISEDDWHSSDKKLQGKVDKVNVEIDTLAKAKEKDIMTV